MRSVPVYNIFHRVIAHCSHPEAWSLVSDAKAQVLTMVPFQIQLNTPPQQAEPIEPLPSHLGARQSRMKNCLEAI